jgi:beta-lactamase class A
MMAYFKKAEERPAILSEKLVLPNGLRGVSQNFEVPDLLKVGASYTVEQLIKEMIVASDNRAMVALVQHLPSADMQRVFSDLGLSAQLITDAGDSISPRLYATFLRVLYNATYLSREYSERALVLLSQSSFKVGLVAGLPAGTKIAHKYGERSYGQADEVYGERELHDCGIVYSKAGDYVICVMTKGYDLDKLASAIADISRTTYQFSQRIAKNETQ